MSEPKHWSTPRGCHPDCPECNATATSSRGPDGITGISTNALQDMKARISQLESALGVAMDALEDLRYYGNIPVKERAEIGLAEIAQRMGGT